MELSKLFCASDLLFKTSSKKEVLISNSSANNLKSGELFFFYILNDTDTEILT